MAQAAFWRPATGDRCLLSPVLAGVFLLLCRASALAESSADQTPSSLSEGDRVVEQIVERIDELIRQGWQENELRPSRAATDSQWCRRVFLDVIGRVPTVEELAAYTSNRSPTKRRELVEKLLGSEYLEQYARNWTTIWTNTLIGRTGGRQRRSLTNRGALEAFLHDWLQKNKPYDQLAYELITASGSANPEADDFNGAVNFLVEKLAEDGVQATAKTAQIFLGTAVQCTQCHNHKFNEYRQDQFWEFNAFFRQARLRRRRDPDDDSRRLASIADEDFAGEGRNALGDERREIFLELRDGKLVDVEAAEQTDAPIFYEQPNGEVRLAYPVYLDSRSLADELADRGSPYGNSGEVRYVNRRAELAKLIVADRQFDRALVNRLWAHFLGHGFTKPPDDMGPHNPPSHPQLLDELGQAFRTANFDQKALVKWIVLSKPYSLSSRIGRANREDDPTLGATPQFSRFYVRQMQAEQLYESLLVATEADETVSAGERAAMKDRWLRQFNTAFGTDDAAESTTFNGSIPQVLTMMNGDLVRRACSTGSGSFLDRIAHDGRLSNREKIIYLYRTALARLPTKEETNLCNELLAARGDVVESLQDIWWAVLNSNEFVLIH
jgi:hypothetical protein